MCDRHRSTLIIFDPKLLTTKQQTKIKIKTLNTTAKNFVKNNITTKSFTTDDKIHYKLNKQSSSSTMTTVITSSTTTTTTTTSSSSSSSSSNSFIKSSSSSSINSSDNDNDITTSTSSSSSTCSLSKEINEHQQLSNEIVIINKALIAAKEGNLKLLQVSFGSFNSFFFV